MPPGLPARELKPVKTVSLPIVIAPVAAQLRTATRPGDLSPGGSGAKETQARLARGEVVVELTERDHIKYVVSRIWIDQPPEAVWPVLANPFEFQGSICPRMKTVEVLTDKAETSVLQCSFNVCFLFPTITYAVQSDYCAPLEVQFHRVGGMLKDFRGYWLLRPVKDGAKQKTEVFYSMYVDPGIPAPKWLVREAVKSELPRTLCGLKERVRQIYEGERSPIKRSILAAGTALKTTQLAGTDEFRDLEGSRK
ncbi:MAG TPA: SRPBCC family protein [Chroococcales cyanobacterium]